MRAAVMGSVDSSVIAVEALDRSDIDLVGVAGFEPADVSKVSGWANLRGPAEKAGAQYLPFTKANAPEVAEWLESLDLDYLFVVGLSQLVSERLIHSVRIGCIGYHPTALPQGRGRAPVAWLVLGASPAASTLFEIMPGADEGGVLAQVGFEVTDQMDAADVVAECSRTLGEALDQLLPALAQGRWEPVAQDDEQATWNGKRDAFDGLVDWTRPAAEVDRLIRAAAHPHPGAYCYHKSRKLVIGRSLGVQQDSRHRGVVGKVLRGDGESFDVQCGEGVVRIGAVTPEDDAPLVLRDGALLRTPVEDELHDLRARVDELTKLVHERLDLGPQQC